MVRIPRCGRGDLGSNPSSHKYLVFYFGFFRKPNALAPWLDGSFLYFFFGFICFAESLFS